MWLDKLRQMKKEAGKTSQMISDETGISKSTIDKLLTGRTKDPALSMVKSIVHSLGYTLDDLDDTKKDIVFTNNSEGDIHKQKLLENYDLLNENARHTLVEYSDFMVSKRDNLKDDYNCDKMNA